VSAATHKVEIIYYFRLQGICFLWPTDSR